MWKKYYPEQVKKREPTKPMSEPNDYLPGTEEAQVESQQGSLPAVVTTPNPVAAHQAGIAQFLASAYSKAGTLKLSPEESKALMADFPDEAFRNKAAGKEDLHHMSTRT